MKQSDILEAAEADDIAEKTLRRAKKELGIESYKAKGINAEWYWRIPATQS